MATLIVVGFKKDLYRASEVLNELIDRGYQWTSDLEDAVAVYRDYNGKLRVDSSFQMTTGQEIAMGSLLRSLVGLTLGVIAGPTPEGTNTFAGTLDGKWWKGELGIPDDFIQDVGALVQPGDSAIYALLRLADPTLVTVKSHDYGGVVLCAKLSSEQATKIQDMLSGKNKSHVAGISRN